MRSLRGHAELFARFTFDRRGNFALLTALALPVLLGAAGVAIDITSLVATRSELQGYVDSAALAAAAALANKEMTIEAGKTYATNFFFGQYDANHAEAAPVPEVLVTNKAGAANVAYTVDVKATKTVSLSPFMALLGHHFADVSVAGSATSSRGMPSALSMFLVLDRSGSMAAATTTVKSRNTPCDRYTMDEVQGVQYVGYYAPCYYSRMESLQTAAKGLFDALENVDPSHKAIRTGAIGYNNTTLPETALDWGTNGAEDYIGALTPEADTNSSPAFATAVKRISDPMEEAHQHNANGLPLKKAILFMTDGINTQSDYDAATLRSCAQAKAGGVTIFAVAFSAAESGRKLLSACASSPATFFYPTDTKQLYDAFQDIGRSVLQQAPLLTR